MTGVTKGKGDLDESEDTLAFTSTALFHPDPPPNYGGYIRDHFTCITLPRGQTIYFTSFSPPSPSPWNVSHSLFYATAAFLGLSRGGYFDLYCLCFNLYCIGIHSSNVKP